MFANTFYLATNWSVLLFLTVSNDSFADTLRLSFFFSCTISTDMPTLILAAPLKCLSSDFNISVAVRDGGEVETMETEGADVCGWGESP